MPVTRSQKSTTATNNAADSQDGATGLNRGLSDSDAQNRVHKSARAEMRSILEGNDLSTHGYADACLLFVDGFWSKLGTLIKNRRNHFLLNQKTLKKASDLIKDIGGKDEVEKRFVADFPASFREKAGVREFVDDSKANEDTVRRKKFFLLLMKELGYEPLP